MQTEINRRRHKATPVSYLPEKWELRTMDPETALR